MEKVERKETITYDLHGVTREEMTLLIAAVVEYERHANETALDASQKEMMVVANFWKTEAQTATRVLDQLDKAK